MAQIEFTKVEYDKLKKAYARAIKNNEAEFEFMGETMLTTYARYVLEYLKSKFDKMK